MPDYGATINAAWHRKRFQELETRASSWRAHWREIADNVRPRSARFLAMDAGSSAGQEKHGHLINSVPALSSRTLSAGLHSGITSPSRPWFGLALRDRQQGQTQAAKQYLQDVRDSILELFAKSNVYGALHVLYSDLVDYGTGLALWDEDEEDELRGYTFPIGSYVLVPGERQDVVGFYRRVQMPVEAVVEKFGLEACSNTVQAAYNSKRFDDPVDVEQAILRNPKPGPERTWATEPYERPWRSCWWEKGASDGEKFLKESGYYERPFTAPRWETTGEDVYGSSPGMLALGDARALQRLEARRARMHEKIVDPPTIAPASLKQRGVSMLPGVTTYLSRVTAGDMVRPIHEVPPQGPAVAAADIREHEARIRQAYYADLWLMLSQSETTMTAREVSERREEKLLQLGSVLEKMQDELLEPLIMRAFGVLQRAGQLPPPPEELQGQPWKVEYISLMAQAQKMLAVTGMDRVSGMVSQLAQQGWPQATDKVNVDRLVDAYAEATGVSPAIIRGDDEVEKMRAERVKMQQAAQAQEQAPVAAQTAKTLSETDTSSSNALTEMLRGVGVR